MESLAKKAAKLVRKADQLLDRIAVTEREIVSSKASGVDPADLKFRLNDLRRRARGPVKQKESVLARLKAMGGEHLLGALR